MADAIVAALRDDWRGVVKAINVVFGGNEFILLAEDGDATQRLHFKKTTTLDENARMPHGRAFDKKCEVRWRERAGGRFIIIYLSEEGPPAEIGFARSNEQWTVSDRSCQKLYGKWSKEAEDWIEVAVPGVSGYYKQFLDTASSSFDSDSPTMSLEVVHYIRDGQVQMTRFCEVQKFER
jgi:hypothetical protein